MPRPGWSSILPCRPYPPLPSCGLVWLKVTFLGSRTATVNYDYVNGNVFLNNFQNGAGAALAGGFRRAGASGLLLMTLTLGLLLCSFSARSETADGPSVGISVSENQSLTQAQTPNPVFDVPTTFHADRAGVAAVAAWHSLLPCAAR